MEASSKNHIPSPVPPVLATLCATRRVIYSLSGGTPSKRYRIPTDWLPTHEGRRYHLNRLTVGANRPQFVCHGLRSPFNLTFARPLPNLRRAAASHAAGRRPARGPELGRGHLGTGDAGGRRPRNFVAERSAGLREIMTLISIGPYYRQNVRLYDKKY